MQKFLQNFERYTWFDLTAETKNGDAKLLGDKKSKENFIGTKTKSWTIYMYQKYIFNPKK